MDTLLLHYIIEKYCSTLRCTTVPEAEVSSKLYADNKQVSRPETKHQVSSACSRLSHDEWVRHTVSLVLETQVNTAA